MRRIRTLAAAALVTASALVLAACGGADPAKDPNAAIRVGVSPVPHAEILRYVADNLAKDKGIKVDVVEINDYVTPNTALAEGQLEANYFQHKPYLEEFQASRNIKLQSVGAVHVEPLAVFSKKVKKIEELPQGAKVALPNDPSNLSRSLNLLASTGLIKLKPGTEAKATKQDVAENPKRVELLETEAAQLPRSLDDADAAVVNGNYQLEAKLDLKTALAVEKAEGNAYANLLVTRPELAEDKRVKALAELLRSQQVREFIGKTFPGGVIPA